MKKTVLSLLVVLLLAASFCAAAAQGDKTLYNRAVSLYESQKYYDAYDLFIQSQYEDWEARANKCIRRWPRQNGELWRDKSQWLVDTRITFDVEQPDDSAIFLRIYKDKEPMSYVFIGGTDKVTIGVPGNGTYMIMDGVGSDWFGPDDAFGPNGAYETMTFGKYEEETYYFEARYEYTITINIKDAKGEDIGSDPVEWEDFRG